MKRTMKDRIPYWGAISEPVKNELTEILSAFEIAIKSSEKEPWKSTLAQVKCIDRIGELSKLGAIGNQTENEVRFMMAEIKEKHSLQFTSKSAITDGLRLVFQGIESLKKAFPHREFTIDGRLVGDVGEVIAALEYDLVLHDVSQPKHDATSSDGKNVQIKATFKDSLTFRSVPDYYLGFKLYSDGRHELIYNGPGKVIFDRYASRKGIGVALLSFPIAELRRLSELVPNNERIQKRS